MDDKQDTTLDAATSIARAHWPVLVVAGAAVFIYLDLRSDISALRDEMQRNHPAERPDAGVLPSGISSPESPGSPPTHAAAPVPMKQYPPEIKQGVLWQCSGTIPHDKLLAEVGRRGQGVFECYDKSLDGLKGRHERLLVEILVSKSGQMLDSRATGRFEDENLFRCVVESLKTWESPAVEGGDCAIVSIPFSLGVKEGKQAASLPAAGNGGQYPQPSGATMPAGQQSATIPADDGQHPTAN